MYSRVESTGKYDRINEFVEEILFLRLCVVVVEQNDCSIEVLSLSFGKGNG